MSPSRHAWLPALALLLRQAREHARIAVQAGGLERVESLHDLGERQGHRDLAEANRTAGSPGASHARAMDSRAGGDQRDLASVRRRTARRQGTLHRAAIERQRELGPRLEILDEDAAPARAAARRQAEIRVEQRLRFVRRGRQRPLAERARDPPVGQRLVEVVHQLGLRHDRETREVLELEAVGIDRAQPPGMEGGALAGNRQQRAQALELPRGDLRRAPVEPPDVLGQMSFSWPAAVNSLSGLTVAAPDSTLMLEITFCGVVSRAQRNCPVSRSSV